MVTRSQTPRRARHPQPENLATKIDHQFGEIRRHSCQTKLIVTHWPRILNELQRTISVDLVYIDPTRKAIEEQSQSTILVSLSDITHITMDVEVRTGRGWTNCKKPSPRIRPRLTRLEWLVYNNPNGPSVQASPILNTHHNKCWLTSQNRSR